MKEHFYIRVAEIGSCMPDGFRKSELKNAGQFTNIEKKILDDYFTNAWNNGASGGNRETFFYILERISSAGEDNSIYILKSDILFNYIDYLELQEARKSSKQAMRIAIIAIVLNLVAIGVQICTSFSTQIDKGQFQELVRLLETKNSPE